MCDAKQYSDQMHCATCSMQWDVNDEDPPACRQLRQAKDRGRATADEWLKRIFAVLED